MILFDSIGLSIGLMFLSMFFAGSWPNLFKYRERDYRKEHLFVIYGVVCFIVAIFFAFTMGTVGAERPNFIDNLHTAHSSRVGTAFLGGVCIALANLLMLFGAELAGLAIAMPLTNGISIIGGTLLNYAIVPVSRFYLLMVGVSCIVVALVFQSLSIVQRQKSQTKAQMTPSLELTKIDEVKEHRDNIGLVEAASAEESCSENKLSETDIKNNTKKGVIFSVIGGFFGIFWSPLSTYSMDFKGLDGTLTAYTAFFYFMMGLMIAAVLINIYFMHRPANSKQPIGMMSFLHLEWKVWALGAFAGILCSIGNLLLFVAGQSSGGFAVSFAISRANTLVSGIYGVLLWKEYHNTNAPAKILFGLCLFFYVGGIVCLANSL